MMLCSPVWIIVIQIEYAKISSHAVGGTTNLCGLDLEFNDLVGASMLLIAIQSQARILMRLKAYAPCLRLTGLPSYPPLRIQSPPSNFT
jgi:hypothetical protein